MRLENSQPMILADGSIVAPGRLFMVWARSSKPPAYSDSPYHQVIYGATLHV